MNMNIDILSMSHALAVYAERRQSVVSANVANANTPGYRARDLAPFSDIVSQPQAPFQMRATRPSHFRSPAPDFALRNTIIDDGEKAPNGNTVSLSEQMAKAAIIRQQHEMALGIYQKSMNILRMSLGR